MSNFGLYPGTITDKAYDCPNTIRTVVSPTTGLAEVNLTTAGIKQVMRLPLGTYKYERGSAEEDKPCQVTVDVKGR